ncbi:MAG: Crp/Fnr family transcriptional regulator [Phycisphaerae bacterium]
MAKLPPGRLDVLKQVPLFSALDEAALSELLRNCPVRSVAAGEAIFQPGRAADRFHVVLEGLVKVYQLSPQGQEQTLHLYGPGCTFGEAAMFAGGDYPAWARAAEDARVLEVLRAVLERAMCDRPELTLGMLAGLSSKLREFARLIERLSLKDVPSRVAAALLEEADGRREFRLGQTKRQLASKLGTTPETLSRSLGKLSDAGYIHVKGGTVTINDAEALRRLAQQG